MQAYGPPGGGAMAATEAERRLDEEVEAAVHRAEVFTEARRRIDAVTVTHRSPDGAVSVTVSSSGAVLDVTCTEQVRTMPPHQIAATFQACVQAAQAGLADRVEDILRTAAPNEQLTDKLVDEAHEAFPPPLVPTTSTMDVGPQDMSIGGIEDRGPRQPQPPQPPRRRPALPRRPARDDPDDWGDRSVLS